MPAQINDYSFIQQKINTLKLINPFLRKKTDDFAFSAVCIRYSIFKNPSLILSQTKMNVCQFAKVGFLRCLGYTLKETNDLPSGSANRVNLRS